MTVGSASSDAGFKVRGLLIRYVVASIVPTALYAECLSSHSIARSSAAGGAQTSRRSVGPVHIWVAAGVTGAILEIARRSNVTDGGTSGCGGTSIDTSFQSTCLGITYIIPDEICCTRHGESLVDCAIHTA